MTTPVVLVLDDVHTLHDFACRAALLRQPITASQAADLARLLKAMADPTRLRLVSMVAAHEGGEACVCDLTEPLGLTQPTVSHHLKILVEAGSGPRAPHAAPKRRRGSAMPWAGPIRAAAPPPHGMAQPAAIS